MTWVPRSAKIAAHLLDNPGLDTLLIRSLSTRSALGAPRPWARPGRERSVAVGADKDGRMARMLPLIPRRAYDALMTGMLTIGTAVGALRGGEVHVALLRDSDADPAFQDPLPGHPEAQIRRVDAPALLSDMCADIDELYWSRTIGPAIKITRVGDGEARRWLLSLVGTESMTWRSTNNPADAETNIRLMLGLESAMSVASCARCTPPWSATACLPIGGRASLSSSAATPRVGLSPPPSPPSPRTRPGSTSPASYPREARTAASACAPTW